MSASTFHRPEAARRRRWWRRHWWYTQGAGRHLHQRTRRLRRWAGAALALVVALIVLAVRP